MKKSKRQSKVIIAAILVAAVLAGGILYYITYVKNSLWNQAVSGIMEVAAQGSHAFEVYIEKDMQILSRIEKYLSKENSTDETGIIDVVEAFDEPEVRFTVAVPESSRMYGRNSDSTRELTDVESELYRTFTGMGVREPYEDEYTEERMIGGYLCFTFADGKPGVVQVKRRVAVVVDEFMLSFYDNAGFSYIVNREGDILLRPSHKSNGGDFSTILDGIRYSGNSAEKVQKFSASLAEDKKGAMRLFFNGEQNIFTFTPVKGTGGWYLITIVPDDVIMKHADEILKSSQTFAILLGIIFITAGIFIYAGQRTQKRIVEKEDDVRYRELLFSILANNTNDVFLMFKTSDYSVEYISPNVERVLGIPQEEIMANLRVLEQSVSDDGKDINYDVIKNLKLNDYLVREGKRLHKKSGEWRWFMETIFKTSVNDTERFVAVLSDRTHERESEQALKEALEVAKAANESKSVFLSNMSHDIRTPMNAIVGLSTLLQRDADNPEKVQEYTRKITSSSQHLLGLINDVLDMSKIESGKATLNISEISLAELVDELGTMMQPQAKAKGQDFKINVYNVCNEEVLGDRLRINQVLINILSNAIKYTPEGGKVEMTVRQLPQHTKNYARFLFTIKDNGIGMSKEYLDTIFQPFTRETTGKTLGIQGTGLGMAITKNLVDLMGGTIKIESEPDKGSTFTIGLELRIKEQKVDVDFWKKSGITKMLVVDDDEEICEGIRNVMANTGVEIEYALKGEEAIQKVTSAQEEGRGFDFLLIDWQMSDIDGIETVRRVRKIVSSGVKIMILTAYDISRLEEAGFRAGVDGFLQKPFFISNLKMIACNLKGDKEPEQKVEDQDDILEGKRILAAEDIELNAEILTELLKMAGAECDWASNGQEALEKFQKSAPGRYDMILMDVQMPVMDGYEATGAIRRCGHPQAKTVPIVAMTANAFSEDVKEALDAGMNAHLAKPIDMERLKAVAREVAGVRNLKNI